MQDAHLWTRQAGFAAQTLASLRELNHRFLDLAAAHSESPGDLKMQQDTAAPIAACRKRHAPRRRAVPMRSSICASTTMRTGAHVSAKAGASRTRRPLRTMSRPSRVWRCSTRGTSPRLRSSGAQLWLGMPDSTAAAFRAASLERLPALAASEGVNLSARWSTSTFYWKALASAAARGDLRRLRRVQLFGLQLGAARLLP